MYWAGVVARWWRRFLARVSGALCAPSRAADNDENDNQSFFHWREVDGERWGHKWDPKQQWRLEYGPKLRLYQVEVPETLNVDRSSLWPSYQ